MEETNITKKADNKREQLKIELIKQQMDSKLMMLEAIEAAKVCY